MRDGIDSMEEYPFNIPAVRHLEEIEFHPAVTFFVGENGTGKSTLIEGIAIASGLNPEGGSRNFNFSVRHTESHLHEYLRIVRGARRPKTDFFLRAESFYNVASMIDDVDKIQPVLQYYGGKSLHAISHGESFLALVKHRFGPNGLYVLDEPEAALSPMRQLSLLRLMRNLVNEGSQFVIATHSPIILAFPDAKILLLEDRGVEEVQYESLEHVQLTLDFLENRERYLDQLFRP